MKYHFPKEGNFLERFKILLVAVPAFLIFVSYLYLFTYYSFFDVDIFNYISVNSIISYSVKSIGIVAVLATIGYLILLSYDYLLDKVIKLFISLIDKLSIPDNKYSLITAVSLGTLTALPIMYGLQVYLVDFLFKNETTNSLVKLAILLFLLCAFTRLPYGLKKVTFKANVHSFKQFRL